MPPPPVLLAPGAIAAAKHMAFHASTYIDFSTFTSATFAAILAQWIWKRVPPWLKEDITFRKLLRNSNGGITREELSHIGSVIDKLQALAKSASVEPVPQLHAAFLAYIQLSGQLKLQQIQNHPSTVDESVTRDYLYKTSGREIPIGTLQSKEFRNALLFATWAYHDNTEVLKERLDQLDFTLLQHSVSSRPGTVSYYLAVLPEQRNILLGVRGTSTLEDILTDCCGRAVPLDGIEDDTIRIEVKAAKSVDILLDDENDVELVSGHERIDMEDHDDDGDKFIRCHEGILISAENLVAEIEPLISDLICNCGYRLVLCGHSLGAGAATLAAVILRQHFGDVLQQEGKLQVYGFAPPPILDHDSAIAASAFCTSIVYNADMVPRCSLSNLSVLFECLRRVQERLVDEDLIPTGPLRTQAFIKKLAQGTSGEPLIDSVELNSVVTMACEKVEIRRPEHLFIPGKAILVYNPWLSGESEENEYDELSSVSWKCIETDGTAAVFRTLELDGPRPFADHMTASYFNALDLEYQF